MVRRTFEFALHFLPCEANEGLICSLEITGNERSIENHQHEHTGASRVLRGTRVPLEQNWGSGPHETVAAFRGEADKQHPVLSAGNT